MTSWLSQAACRDTDPVMDDLPYGVFYKDAPTTRFHTETRLDRCHLGGCPQAESPALSVDSAHGQQRHAHLYWCCVALVPNTSRTPGRRPRCRHQHG